MFTWSQQLLHFLWLNFQHYYIKIKTKYKWGIIYVAPACFPPHSRPDTPCFTMTSSYKILPIQYGTFPQPSNKVIKHLLSLAVHLKYIDSNCPPSGQPLSISIYWLLNFHFVWCYHREKSFIKLLQQGSSNLCHCCITCLSICYYLIEVAGGHHCNYGLTTWYNGQFSGGQFHTERSPFYDKTNGHKNIHHKNLEPQHFDKWFLPTSQIPCTKTKLWQSNKDICGQSSSSVQICAFSQSGC